MVCLLKRWIGPVHRCVTNEVKTPSVEMQVVSMANDRMRMVGGIRKLKRRIKTNKTKTIY